MKYRLVIFFLSFVALTSCNRLGHGGKSQPKSDGQPAVTRNDAITVAQAKEEYTFMQGCIEYSIGNYEEARIAFLDVIKLDDKSAATYYMLADIYRRQGDLATAITYAESAVKSGGDNEWYNVRLGELYLLRGRNDDAIAQYQKACSLDPDNTDMLLKLGEAQLNVGKYADALSTYNKVESMEGLSDTLCNARLNVYSAMHDVNMQSQTYRSLIDAFPYEKENYYRYAGFFHSSGMNDSALSIYKLINGKFAGETKAWVEMADIMHDEKKADAFATAVKAFNMQGAVDSKSALLKSWYPASDSSAALTNAQQKEADTLCAILRRTDPDNALSYSLSGDYLYKKRNFKESRAMYAKAVALDGNSYETWTRILVLNQLLNDDAQQEKDCKALIDLYPAQPDAYYYLGMLQLKKNDYVHAAPNLQAAKDYSVSKTNYSSMIDLQLVAAYRGKGDDAKADAASESAIASDSTNYPLMIAYASSLEQRQVKLDVAQKILMKCITANPGNGSALELMGDILFRQGNKDEALNYWKKAKAAGINSPVLDKKIATGSLE